MADTWTFTQLGDKPREPIELSNYAAPFGRPRQGEVFKDGLELREQRVYYPGNNSPTTHVFGVKQDDLQLRGRWQDRYLGKDGARRLLESFQKFVQDGKQILISWGGKFAYTGYLKRVNAQWESTTEVVWQLDFLIDSNVGTMVSTTIIQPTIDPKSLQSDLALFGKKALPYVEKEFPSGDFLERLDDAISAYTSTVAKFAKIANEVDSIEGAAFHEVQRLIYGTRQVKTALAQFDQTLDSVIIDEAVVFRSAKEDVKWLQYRLDMKARFLDLMAKLAETERLLEENERGIASTTYTAKYGDTIESISSQQTGGLGNVDAIRKANGLKASDPIVPGQVYVIPK